jgi:deoxyadenosine kinase
MEKENTRPSQDQASISPAKRAEAQAQAERVMAATMPAECDDSSSSSSSLSSSAPTTPDSKSRSMYSSTSAFSFDIHQAVMENVFVGISGLIGAGKSTLATALAKKLNLPVYYEPVKDNVYLADFYSDIGKYSFAMQIYLLNKRFKQQQEIIWQGKGGVQDRTIYEDAIFAKMLSDVGLMDKRDYETYCSLFSHMSNFMKKPNIIVHLDVSPEESYRRIQMRNRDVEKGITLEYLKNLYQAYEGFIRDISRIIPVIKINYETFRTVDEMASAIATEYAKLTNITKVSFNSPSTHTSADAEEGVDTPQSSGKEKTQTQTKKKKNMEVLRPERTNTLLNQGPITL